MRRDSDVYQDMPFASLKVLKFDQTAILWSRILKILFRKNDSYLTQTSDGGYALAGIYETNRKKLAIQFDLPGLANLIKILIFNGQKAWKARLWIWRNGYSKSRRWFEMGWKKGAKARWLSTALFRPKTTASWFGNMSGLSCCLIVLI